MFIDNLKKEVGEELKIAAELLKQGSQTGYNHLRNTLGHALYFAYEDEAIAMLQHVLGPIRPEVIIVIASQNKEALVAIGKELDLIADVLVNEEPWENIIKPLVSITLIIEKEWRKILTTPDIVIPKVVLEKS